MAATQIAFLLSCLSVFSSSAVLRDAATPVVPDSRPLNIPCQQDSDCPFCNITWSDSAGNSGGASAPSFDVAVTSGVIVRVKRMPVGGQYIHGTCYCELFWGECDVNASCWGLIDFLGMAEVGGSSVPVTGRCLKASRTGGSQTGSASYVSGDYNQTDNLISAEVDSCGDTDTVTILVYAMNANGNCTPPGTLLYTYTFTMQCGSCW